MAKASKRRGVAAVIGVGAGGAVPIVRNEGQRLFLQVEGTLDSMVARLGSGSRQVLHAWRLGKYTPRHSARARIENAFGIPRIAWDQAPLPLNGMQPPPATTLSSPATVAPLVVEPDFDAAAPRPSSLEHCLQLLDVMRKHRSQPGILSSERMKFATTEAQILSLRERLERASELAEDRYVREHPAWVRLRNAITAALVAHPEAGRAVQEALKRLRMGEE